jgi:hypothetical protein
MFKRSRAFLVVSLFVFGVAVIAWAGTNSPSFQKCNADYESGNPHHPTSDSDQPVASLSGSERLWRFARCEAVFLDENQGLVTALATLGIAVFTLTLWLATGKQVEISARLATIAHRQFSADHRPRVRIRYVDYDPNKDDRDGNLIGALVHFTNVGATSARIILIWARIFRASAATLRELTTYPGGMERASQTLDAGDSDSSPIRSEFRDVEESRRDRVTVQRQEPKETIFLLGRIQYLDDAGTSRETGFCWHLDIAGQRWLRTTDQPELNYEE